jgi:hypothetical protein
LAFTETHILTFTLSPLLLQRSHFGWHVITDESVLTFLPTIHCFYTQARTKMSSLTRAAALTCVLGQSGRRYLIERILQNKVAEYGRVYLARYVFSNRSQNFATDVFPARKIASSYRRAFPKINANIIETCSMISETLPTFELLMILSLNIRCSHTSTSATIFFGSS